MILIGIAGPAQAGKSTLAGEFRRLVESRGQKYAEKPFAGPLKRMLASIGVDVSDLSKNAPEAFLSGRITPRVMMQTLGTEWAGHCCLTWGRVCGSMSLTIPPTPCACQTYGSTTRRS